VKFSRVPTPRGAHPPPVDSPRAHNQPPLRPPVENRAAADVGVSGGVPTPAPRARVISAATFERTRDIAPVGTWVPGTAMADRLADLWDEGLSCTEIGRRLGYTKNAIVGASRRLDLPRRPSPIYRTDNPSKRVLRLRAKRAALMTLPPLASVAAATPPPVPTPHAPTRSRAPHIVPPKRRTPSLPALVAAPTPPPPIARTGRVVECCWPVGLPGKPGFFCEAASEPGKPYCADHCELAYVGYGKWRSDNARALRGDAA
jgi:GcrA cell cycle regulator